jgi:short-subunit dehydrogenase
MSESKGQLALVTGASSGIGLAYARALARRGCDLILVGRRRERLDALVDELRGVGTRAEAVVADLGTVGGIAAIEALCRDRALDLLVNNAGVGHYMRFAELPPERLDELLAVNTVAVVKLARAALGGMLPRRRGAIINVSSLLAFSGPLRLPILPNRAVYAGTKAFLVAFTQALASEVEGTGVKLQVVCPGVVVSEFQTRQGMDMTGRPRMPVDDFVRASLADLDAGVLVSVPPLEDAAVFGELDAAQAKLFAQASRPTLGTRYGQG